MKKMKMKIFRIIENDGDGTIIGKEPEEVEKFISSGIEVVSITQTESMCLMPEIEKKRPFMLWNLTITVLYKE